MLKGNLFHINLYAREEARKRGRKGRGEGRCYVYIIYGFPAEL